MQGWSCSLLFHPAAYQVGPVTSLLLASKGKADWVFLDKGASWYGDSTVLVFVGVMKQVAHFDGGSKGTRYDENVVLFEMAGDGTTAEVVGDH